MKECPECGGKIVPVPLDSFDPNPAFEYVCSKCGLVSSEPMPYQRTAKYEDENWLDAILKPPKCICGANDYRVHQYRDSPPQATCNKCGYTRRYTGKAWTGKRGSF